MNLVDLLWYEHLWLERVRQAWHEYHVAVAEQVVRILARDESMCTELQQEQQDMIVKAIRYHLELDGVKVTEAQARNVARHLQMVVPEWRETRGPKY